MPTYSYTCNACNHAFDAFQKITEGALEKCPSCGKSALKRGVGGGTATFQFKGDGFYVNDYKKGLSSEEGAQSHSCGCGKKTKCCQSKKD